MSASDPLLAVATESLRIIEDDLAGGLVEHLALAVVQRDEELRGVRAVQSAALEQLHGARSEIDRLCRRLAEARNDRAERSAVPVGAQAQGQGQGKEQHKQLRETPTATPTQVQTPTLTPRTKPSPRTRTRARRSPWTCDDI